MKTAVGQRLAHSAIRRRISVATTLIVIPLDLFIITFRFRPDVRVALALTAFATLVCVHEGDLDSLGFRLTPKQGWLAWVRMSLFIGLAVVLCIGIYGVSLYLSDREIPVHTIAPHNLAHRFLGICFVAPVIEETLYRFVVCVPLVVVLGSWKTIAVSGVLFGALHVVYGTPSPENLVGGFFLAWAFLKSESIVMPVILHSVGNLFVFSAQAVAWHFLN